MSDKLPIPKNEKERLKALEGYNIMDSFDEEEFDRLTKLASLICEVPIALVSLVDGNRQWFKSKVGLDAPETPRDISFCQYAIVGDEVFQVEDARQDVRFKDNPLVTGAPGIKFYAGYPLMDPDGFALGTLCVIDREPKKLDATQLIALELLSKEVVSQIVSRKRKFEREKLEKLFNASLDMICIAGADGFFKKVNPAFSNILSWAEEDLLGKPFFDFFHPDDIASSIEAFEQLGKGAKLVGFKNRCRTKNGKYLVINWHANPDPETGEMYAIGRDVTEEISKSEDISNLFNFQNTVLDGADYSIIATELDGTISVFNKGAQSLLGYSKEEVVGKTSPAIFHDLDEIVERSKVLSKELKTIVEPGFGVFIEKAKLGKPDANEWTYISKSGKRIPVEISVTALYNSKKEITGYLGIGKNLTESKKRIAEIEQLKNALDESAIVAITNQKGIIEFANDKFCEISKYEREELIGKDHRILNSGFHSDKFMKNLWSTIKSGKIWKGEIKNKNKNGDFYWVDTTIVPFLDSDNKPDQYVAIRHDITKQKKLEHELDAELSAINGSVLRVELNINGNILSSNEDFQSLIGYGKDELSEMHHFDLIKEKEETYKLFWSKLMQGENQKGVFKRYKKDDTPIWIRGSYIPVKNQNNEVVKVIKIAYDVTENELTKLKLEKAVEIAEHATKAKDEFLANMSHEIRTPMNAIVGFTELLNSTETTREQQNYIDSIQTAGRSLLTIINDILDFAKIESGMLTFSESTFLINDVVSHTKKTLASLANKKGLKFQFYTDSDIVLPIVADEGRLTQVLTNLIGNAIKFTEKGKVEIFTSLTEETENDYKIKFTVKDTGIGINKDKINAIFNRFQQAEEYTTRKFGGTGLGLSISRKIIELMGGELEVESEFGVGSEFYFTLKFTKSKESSPKVVAEEEIQNRLFSGNKILLIEDNELNQILVKNFLNKENIELVIANKGKEGVDELLKEGSNYDLVLMDLQMPIMSGYEAATFIRKKVKSTIPIIAMTAHSLVGEKSKCLELGMNEYISKPYTKHELITKIGKFIEVKDESLKTVNSSDSKTISKLKELSGGDVDFMKEMIAIFLRNGKKDVDALVFAINKQDEVEINHLAHKLKSSFGMFDLNKGYTILNRIELKKYKNQEELLMLIEELTRIVEITFNELKHIKI
jgi:PAS domain S-box-containing protein